MAAVGAEALLLAAVSSAVGSVADDVLDDVLDDVAVVRRHLITLGDENTIVEVLTIKEPVEAIG